MQRFTISLDDPLAVEFDALIATLGYVNRSEAVRDLIRTQLGEAHLRTTQSAWCVASLSYVYDHHDKTVTERVMSLQHDHHDLVITSLHTHLDHHHCMETVVLRGPTHAVSAFSRALVALRGVRHGSVHMIPLEEDAPHIHPQTHNHEHEHMHADSDATALPDTAHIHLKPLS